MALFLTRRTSLGDGPRLLRRWMRERKLRERHLKVALRLSTEQIVQRWMRGINGPSVPSAVLLEDLSEGEVPVRSWVRRGLKPAPL